MFPRRKRIARSQFPAALETGKRYTSQHFSAVVPPETHGYAVIVPKKVVRLASARHHVKRHVLEAMKSFPLPPALIIFVRYAPKDTPYQDIKAELKFLLSKIRN